MWKATYEGSHSSKPPKALLEAGVGAAGPPKLMLPKPVAWRGGKGAEDTGGGAGGRQGRQGRGRLEGRVRR